jgi:multisubunit Na+/H+ antiporter MnhC subunit
MDGIITAVGTVLTGFSTWFASVSTMLLGNDLVKLIIALGIISLLIGLVMSLVSKIRGRKKRRR